MANDAEHAFAQLRTILGGKEFESLQGDILFLLPIRERQRIKEKLKDEPNGDPLGTALSVEIGNIFVQAYELVQNSGAEKIRQYCELRVRASSERTLETRFLKDYIRDAIRWDFLSTEHPIVAEINSYSDTEPTPKIYELMLRLFSTEEWFPALRNTYPRQDFFREADVLQGLASAVAACLSELEEQVMFSAESEFCDRYEQAFGLHVSFRIKNALFFKKPAEIFDILGSDFLWFRAFTAEVPPEQQKEIAALFGQAFRKFCLDKSYGDWKALRDLVGLLSRSRVIESADWLLGPEEAEHLKTWLVRAREAGRPECSREAMEQILEEIEAVSTKPLKFSHLVNTLLQGLRIERFEPSFGDRPLSYYWKILFRQRMERAIGERWEEWRRLELEWKLRSIRRAL